MSNRAACIKDVFEAAALTWESGRKTNTAGRGGGLLSVPGLVIDGTSRSSCYCNIGPGRFQTDSQTDSHRRAGCLLGARAV